MPASTPGVSSSSSSSSSVASPPLRRASVLQWALIGCIATVLFVSWMYMHHTVTTEHLYAVSNGINNKFTRGASATSGTNARDLQVQQVSRLYDETRNLLLDAARLPSFASLNLTQLLLSASLSSPQQPPTPLKPAAASSSLSTEIASLEKKLTTCLHDASEKSGRINELTSAVAAAKAAAAAASDAAAQKAASVSTTTTSATGTDATSANAPVDTKWLVVGIPSVSRVQDEDYLLHTLESIARQLPREGDSSDLFYNKVVVMVVNVQDPGTRHRRFEEARALYAPGAHPMARYFEFADLPPAEVTADPKPGATARNDPGNANIPGFRVRKQTRNVASIMKMAFARFEGRGQFYLFLEDDMQLCRHGFVAIQYLLQKASRYHPNWLAIRASYGMNGIFLHFKDVPVFAQYLVKHQLRRPPDHLVVEWFAGETQEAKLHKGTRANVGFRHNIFDHIGKYSSLRSELQSAFPRCYELLAEPTVFKVEAFDAAQCPRDDIWPCRGTMSPPDNFRLPLENLGPLSS